jgi:hypothetical protein
MMKIIMKYDEYAHPPLLTLYIHGCPHKRQDRAVLQEFRNEMFRAAQRGIASQVDLPIDHPIDLYALLTNPNSPDLDHLTEAIFMALDEKTLKGPAVLKDDRHIQSIKIAKYYPNAKTKRDGVR